MFENIFKKEKEENNVEAYKKAEASLEDAEKTYRFRGGGAKQWVYDGLSEKIRKAEKKLEKLFDKDHKEALRLNKEYNNLKEAVDKALSDLENFEKDKLGMQK